MNRTIFHAIGRWMLVAGLVAFLGCGAPDDADDDSDWTSGLSANGAIRVACGAIAPYTDSAGRVWAADTGFIGGNLLSPSTTSTIHGAADQQLYTSERWGSFSYKFAVPNGSYAINLKFAEAYVNGPRQREFNVRINGKTVLVNFDIFSAAGGKFLPVDEQFVVDVTGGSLQIDFAPGAIQSPKVDAIEVMPSAVAPSTVQAPFFKVRTQVPGRIAAVNYDVGGPGVAYQEVSKTNQGGVYRPSEAIGIKRGGSDGGYVVGWNESGRWLEYSVVVSTTGTYAVTARVASAAASGVFHIEADGRDVSGPIKVPLTGPWDPETWTTVKANVALTAGNRVLRFVVDAEWFDVDWIAFTPTQAPSAPPPVNGLPVSFFSQNWNRDVNFPTVPFGGLRLWDTETTWAQLEPAAGTYDFTELDKWLAQAGKNGKDVLYTFGRTPQWASMRPTESCSHGVTGCAAPPSDVGKGDRYWKDFVTALVRHSLASTTAHIKYYELWNEANLLQFWTGSIPELLTMANDAYAIIHALDPSARVISPSSSGGSGIALNGWYLNYYAAGGAVPSDIVAYHAYLGPGDSGQGIVRIIDLLRNLMTQYKIANKPLWFTEGSWGNSSTMSTDDAASWIARQHLFMWSKDVDRYYWYSWDNPNWGTLWNTTRGVLPAGIAYGQLTSWLVGSSHGATPCSATADATWTCALTLADGKAGRILWNASGAKTVAVGTSFTAFQTLDNATRHSIVGGAVPIGPKPVLVR